MACVPACLKGVDPKQGSQLYSLKGWKGSQIYPAEIFLWVEERATDFSTILTGVRYPWDPMSQPYPPVTSRIFPRSVLSMSRQEFGDKGDNPKASGDPLWLRFTEDSPHKTLPPDLWGSVYMVGPVGSVDSPVASEDPSWVDPTRDGTILLYNGDGMIYRFDLSEPEQGIRLTTRLADTPDYYADVAANTCPQYQTLKFKSIGITRVGPLGLRNQLNTAFLPMKFAYEDRARLLLTWDMGRPYEIDPVTLALATPMGWNHEWQQVSQLTTLPFQPPQPFQSIQTAAHPYFDPHQNQGLVFTTNIGRSLYNLFSQLIPLGYLLREWVESGFRGGQPTPEAAEMAAETTPAPQPETLAPTIGQRLKEILVLIILFLRGVIDFFTGNFVDLVVWDGLGDLQKWRVLYNNKPIAIRQTTHQIGVTEDYVLIVDTAFKISIEELLPSLNSKKGTAVEKVIRDFLDHPQLAYSPLYIVSRRDLKSGIPQVQARKVMIPWESAHFLVNYKNPKGKIFVHFSFVCAWDAGETVSKFDYLGPDAPHPTPGLAPLYGVLYGPTDISRLGYHLIDGESGQLLESDFVADTDLTWGPAIYAYRYGENYAFTPDELTDVYWICLGCWSELLLPHIIQLYKDYPFRMIALSLMEQITRQGRPSNLLHVHLEPMHPDASQHLQIVDAYAFPDGYYVTTPQFIPAQGSSGPTEGYILCGVHFGERSGPTRGNEIWLFDARNLKQGPIAKLWHPELVMGFTVHSTWLEQPLPRTAGYGVPVREDYEPLVKQQTPQVQELFERWVYPGRIPSSPEDCQGPRD